MTACTSLEASWNESSQEYGIPGACSTIILLMSAHCLARSSPVTSAAFAMASLIAGTSSWDQLTLPAGLMALPSNVGRSIASESVKSLNHPTFGQIATLACGTSQNFV